MTLTIGVPGLEHLRGGPDLARSPSRQPEWESGWVPRSFQDRIGRPESALAVVPAATTTAPEFPNSTAELSKRSRATLLLSSGVQEQWAREGKADRTSHTRDLETAVGWVQRPLSRAQPSLMSSANTLIRWTPVASTEPLNISALVNGIATVPSAPTAMQPLRSSAHAASVSTPLARRAPDCGYRRNAAVLDKALGFVHRVDLESKVFDADPGIRPPDRPRPVIHGVRAKRSGSAGYGARTSNPAASAASACR